MLNTGEVEETKLTKIDMAADSRFQTALAWASELFIDTERKGKPVPYITHLVNVAMLVMQDGANEDEVLAALHHDTIEDQHISVEVITQRLGSNVAKIVYGCSDGMQEDGTPTVILDTNGNEIERGPGNWKERKVAYLTHLAALDKTSPLGSSILRVSVADKLDNATDLVADLREHGPSMMQRFNAGIPDQLWWYKSLRKQFTAKLPDSMLTRRFSHAVNEIENLLEGYTSDQDD